MKTIVKVLTVAALALSVTSASFAESNVLDKPVVKHAAIGAVAGVATGALSERATVGKSAATGAVVGVGTGLLSQSKYLKDKPLVRNTLQGAVVGTGASYATDRNKATGAVLGAGAGAGYHYVKKYMDQK